MMFCCQMLVLPYKWCWCCLSNIISEWSLSKLDLNQLLSATKYISKYDRKWCYDGIEKKNPAKNRYHNLPEKKEVLWSNTM